MLLIVERVFDGGGSAMDRAINRCLSNYGVYGATI